MLGPQPLLHARNHWEMWKPGILTSSPLSKVPVLDPGCIRFIWEILKRYQCLDPSPPLSEPRLGVGAGIAFFFFFFNSLNYSHSLEKCPQSKALISGLVKGV